MEIRKILFSSIFIILLIFSNIFAKNTILIVHPNGDAFNETIEGFKNELGDEYSYIILDLAKLSVNKLKEQVSDATIKVVVLMDNKSVSLYKKANIDNNIPVLALMGVNIQNSLKGIKNSGSISYEIPLVTSLVNLRNVLNKKIETVGVISRKNMKNFIDQNKPFCEREKIKIINVSINSNNKEKINKYIKKGLEILATNKKVDAIWIPNDIKLVNPNTIKNIWSPMLQTYNLPAVVGIESLLTTSLHFGTFAVLPDHNSLGSQAAQVISDLEENDWQFEENFNEPPIGVYTTINKTLAKKISKDINYESVDKIIK